MKLSTKEKYAFSVGAFGKNTTSLSQFEKF